MQVQQTQRDRDRREAGSKIGEGGRYHGLCGHRRYEKCMRHAPSNEEQGQFDDHYLAAAALPRQCQACPDYEHGYGQPPPLRREDVAPQRLPGCSRLENILTNAVFFESPGRHECREVAESEGVSVLASAGWTEDVCDIRKKHKAEQVGTDSAK